MFAVNEHEPTAGRGCAKTSFTISSGGFFLSFRFHYVALHIRAWWGGIRGLMILPSVWFKLISFSACGCAMASRPDKFHLNLNFIPVGLISLREDEPVGTNECEEHAHIKKNKKNTWKHWINSFKTEFWSNFNAAGAFKIDKSCQLFYRGVYSLYWGQPPGGDQQFSASLLGSSHVVHPYSQWPDKTKTFPPACFIRKVLLI